MKNTQRCKNHTTMMESLKMEETDAMISEVVLSARSVAVHDLTTIAKALSETASEAKMLFQLRLTGFVFIDHNPYHGIVHLHAFITVVFRPEGEELTIETLDCVDTYCVKWFLHVCYQEQQDQVGKD
ncbi:hypothetical protein OROMI_027944 [Orobanche minor]